MTDTRNNGGPAVTMPWQPLLWKDHTFGMQPHWIAYHVFGQWDVRQEDHHEWSWVVRPYEGIDSNYPTLEEARAAVEARYALLCTRMFAPALTARSPSSKEA